MFSSVFFLLKAILDLSVKMPRQNTRNEVRQRRHLGKKAYIVIAVIVGLLYVLQTVLNISLRLSLTCSGETEKILKNLTNEEELKNVTNERDELMQKMTQHGKDRNYIKIF
ncbi:hypothetical protein OJAV_G00235310 [Oryzias javanicus]|uniref:Uncharacterized protein n=1 Tax=Oryzias javanicus TaxID=123683 RepID=A0A437BYN3_ORYJA|nr:hypothetical protein OJAV_G00235310 [Oryzias javanicus]